ncbi:xanthine dehydrogenase family protein molybdopterin-binding subunit [Conexibacter stalactiti]|uniref:Xanthine dehydrogenase family protein molybdopterin-binding subunit n=1 Tax=Conexibacter stalactiti TaxID=1940611 RepID=A0ABU4HZS2_9ACTN|nr:xanthine dehydrogenase family protein molybdopterin-binding subunit [Conexibacter stalactiti]MDW5598710.1 xanthine dehydrogenase family protein molybdopterin-binding subunit [Conexibacter stalactiti]MEC5039352.1 xanthine dehydrogenase family protein molybdopterin-binding subunit [Conexibacter stalactiti]
MGAPGAETAEREMPGGNGYVGRALKRKEDPRLITGRATYVDDLVLPSTLYAAIVRSPEAHARITAIDTSAAAAREGVEAVFTGEDLADMAAPCPMVWVPPGVEVHVPEHWPLARGKVGYVGQAVAVVLGDDKYAVVDAAEQVVVDYEPLPVVVDPEAALEEGAPIVHEQFGTNKVFEWSLAGGDVEGVFAAADVVLERRIVNHRTAGAAIEPRGALAEWREGHLTLWSSTQIPHIARVILSIQLGISEERIRVVAPEVGGGFGSKLQVYGEEVLVAWCARKTGRPVKWTATRSDDMLTTHHGRDQIDYVRIAARRDGKMTGIHVRVIQDCGSYHLIEGPVIPTFTSCVISGVYDFDAVQTDVVGVFTNKFTTDAIRGAGRPEATHLLEVCVDQLADELGIDRLELRRRNFITEFPNERPHGFVYDSGDYHGTLDRCLELLDLDAFQREQAQLRERGVHRGVGFSTYVEICGLGPSRALGPDGWGMQGGYFESAQVRVLPTGTAMVYTGTSPHGQGLETSFAQIVADRLGLDPDAIEVIHGDTNTGPFGKDTYGSRSLSVGGEAVARAAQKVQDKAKRIVAHKLEAAPEDIEVSEGAFRVKGSPEQALSLADVATEAYIPADLPEGMEAGLDEICFYDPDNFVWPFGAHACVTEVDVETGRVEIVRWIAVDDCGRAVNPKLIDGQVHGGAAHAIGQALYEQIRYDENGQLVTGTFVDYGLPTAAEIPSFETARTETPSPTNTLGVKGVGEAATIAATPAIVNSVLDALRPLGVSYLDMPLTPERVWAAIQEARR